MQVGGKHYRTIWMEDRTVFMIDQNQLPFRFEVYSTRDYRATVEAIRVMKVRGAGAIGVAGAFAMVQAFLDPEIANDAELLAEAEHNIRNARPTAADLATATRQVYAAGHRNNSLDSRAAVREASLIAEENIAEARSIGDHGRTLFREGTRILTHCNAGWLGFVDYGSALSPVYRAREQGNTVFVYVDETRPRNQGARLTAWELSNEGIPHVIIADNTAASLMAAGKIDMVITGADRIAANGDTANKIGTLDRAILAKYYNIPFYVAAPRSTFDLSCPDGDHILIEERHPDEIIYFTGIDEKGEFIRVKASNPGSEAFNPAFDVTPASLITGIITSGGIIKPEKDTIKRFIELQTI